MLRRAVSASWPLAATSGAVAELLQKLDGHELVRDVVLGEEDPLAADRGFGNGVPRQDRLFRKTARRLAPRPRTRESRSRSWP